MNFSCEYQKFTNGLYIPTYKYMYNVHIYIRIFVCLCHLRCFSNSTILLCGYIWKNAVCWCIHRYVCHEECEVGWWACGFNYAAVFADTEKTPNCKGVLYDCARIIINVYTLRTHICRYIHTSNCLSHIIKGNRTQLGFCWKYLDNLSNSCLFFFDVFLYIFQDFLVSFWHRTAWRGPTLSWKRTWLHYLIHFGSIPNSDKVALWGYSFA